MSDPTGTFGAERTDTSAVVVADGTAMVRASVGVYRYVLTPPALGLTYAWYAEAAYGGATYHFAGTLVDGPVVQNDPRHRLAKWSVVTPPTDTPITVAQAKAQLRITGSDDDTYLALLIDAVTDFAEDQLSASLMPRTLLANFYGEELLILPRGPLIDVVSIADYSGGPITDYDLSHVGNSARATPTGAHAGYPLSVTYRAGYASAASIPAAIRVALLTHVGALYENRESVTDKAKLPVPHSLEDFYKLKSRKVCVG